ncbi:MAG: Trm112 family protein [Weeksellaceae bacterium]|nr:Trm112 family protein [Weeksellaceae bacterium]
MHKDLFQKMCCPFDKHDLDLKIFLEDDDNNILEGLLTCKHCERYFPIIYSIPIMTPDEYRQKQLEEPILQRWGLRADHQSGSFILDQGSRKILEHHS